MQPQTSHQALIRRGDSLLIDQVPTELPRKGGLLIALEYVGVCGTDLQILNGTRPDTAAVLGHEGIGVIALTGEGSRLCVGDRVVFNPVAQISDGRLLGHNVPGLFQQYMSVDARAVDSGLVLPAQECNPPICGALAEPLAAVIYAHALSSRVGPQLRTAVVFGAGPVGLLATQLLSARGTRVFLVHPGWARLGTAVQLEWVSASAVLALSPDLPEQLRLRNDGNRIDAALICTTRQGAPIALQHAVEIVRDGGCIDLITNYPERVAPTGLDTESIRAVRGANVCGIPPEGAYLHADLPGRRITFTGHRGTSAGHLHQALRELQSRTAAYGKVITHVLSLSSAAAAIQTLANSRERTLDGRDCIKAVIDLTTPQQVPYERSRP
jgi:threonine dehydrogenase-like Zn-dependent dehydrogenase